MFFFCKYGIWLEVVTSFLLTKEGSVQTGMDSRASTFDDYRKQLQMVLEDPSEAPVPVSLDFLKDITDGFSSDRLIGRGGFGEVYGVKSFLLFTSIFNFLLQEFTFRCKQLVVMKGSRTMFFREFLGGASLLLSRSFMLNMWLLITNTKLSSILY